MVQASTGIWYAYVADNSANDDDDGDADNGLEVADNNPLLGTSTARGTGFSFAEESGAGFIVSNAGLQNAPEDGGASNADNGADVAEWPYVQLYNFADSDGSLEIVYDDDERITVDYDDDLTGSASISLDRIDVPNGAIVHVTVSDTRLNLDPTGDDVWALAINGSASLSSYGEASRN